MRTAFGYCCTFQSSEDRAPPAVHLKLWLFAIGTNVFSTVRPKCRTSVTDWSNVTFNTAQEDSETLRLSDDCLWWKRQCLTTSIKYVHINNITKYPVYGSFQYWQWEQPPQIILSAKSRVFVVKAVESVMQLTTGHRSCTSERLAGRTHLKQKQQGLSLAFVRMVCSYCKCRLILNQVWGIEIQTWLNRNTH